MVGNVAKKIKMNTSTLKNVRLNEFLHKCSIFLCGVQRVLKIRRILLTLAKQVPSLGNYCNCCLFVVDSFFWSIKGIWT